ncbi:AI-2E family transporter [Levilactobacillus acidifarinae]|uniref:Permease n=1 Tax=Levilactobacillus acidifarinae DSM 19394 = JCM 15949 TaxID=1423715 RepID=A0A0R1LTF9_9LACO|nr:AI-2E family transporter [Levilactobacillus acidifarinae]KRK96193.1 permease [Levilactobacillus acidifarinae DSM 19394]GEO69554.1 AI-2E family transporter [Levilactobacillus acidifarinae]
MNKWRQPESGFSWFYQRFLNNHITILLLNIFLFLLVVHEVVQNGSLLNPVWRFIGIAAPAIIVAGILFYVLDPFVHLMERRLHIKEGLAITIALVLTIAVLVLIFLNLIPFLTRQTASMIGSLPQFANDIMHQLNHANQQHHWLTNANLDEINQRVTTYFSKRGWNLLTGTLSSLGNVVTTVSDWIITLITAPLVLFFMLKDGSHFPKFISRVVPTAYRDRFIVMLDQMNVKVSSYIRGQLTVALCVLIIFTTGYSIIGLKYALLLGVIAGPLNLIPYFGSAIALLPALIIGAITSPSMLLGVVIVYLVEWVLETQVLSPLIMGNSLEMHPITIVFVLLAAGKMFGLTGVILGVPGFAVLKVFVITTFHWYQEYSALYPDVLPDDEALTTPVTPTAATVKETPPTKPSK